MESTSDDSIPDRVISEFVGQDVKRYLSHTLVMDFYKVLEALGKVIRAFKKQLVKMRMVFLNKDVSEHTPEHELSDTSDFLRIIKTS